MINKSVQIVLVLYKMNLEHSIAYNLLIKHIKDTDIVYDLMIYNNSPEYIIEASQCYKIINASKNEMLVGAYNCALQEAKQTGKKWLLLLDQDTVLTREYFILLASFLNKEESHNYVAAVPMLTNGTLHLSPAAYSPFLGPFWGSTPVNAANFKQIKKKCINAFNSASLLDVNFMLSLGGFSPLYPLDMLDYWYFYQIHKQRQQIYVLDAKMEQNLSLLDNSMSVGRYEMFLKSEKQFSKSICFLTTCSQRIKMISRLIKQMRNPEKRKYIRTSLRIFSL